jgi:DNA-binding transcriptional LysR family regulator
MESRLLKPERYVLVASPTWKGRPLKEIVRSERIIDFDPTDPMTHAYLKKHHLLEHARAERHFANNTESVAEMIAQGLGYGVLTAEFAKVRVEAGQLTVLNQGQPLENAMALAWYPRAQPPRYFLGLLKAIR